MLHFRELPKMIIPRVHACACAHVREGFVYFALVCRYLGRFRLEIRRRYYCTAFSVLEYFALDCNHLAKYLLIEDFKAIVGLLDVVRKQHAQ